MNETERKAAELLGWKCKPEPWLSYPWCRTTQGPHTEAHVCKWLKSKQAKWEMIERIIAKAGAITLWHNEGPVVLYEAYDSLIEAFVAVCGEENKNG